MERSDCVFNSIFPPQVPALPTINIFNYSLSLSRIPRNYKFSLSSRWFLTLDLHVCHATHTRLSIQNCAICSSFNTQRQATASHSTILKWNELEVEMERKSVKWEKDNGRTEKEEVCCVVRVFELEPNLMLPNLITKKCRRVFLFAFFLLIYPFNHCHHHHQPQEIIQMWSKTKKYKNLNSN